MAPSATAPVATATKRQDRDDANGDAQTKLQADGGVTPAERESMEKKYKDFFWTYTEEPHRTRRLAIIKAHPEV